VLLGLVRGGGCSLQSAISDSTFTYIERQNNPAQGRIWRPGCGVIPMRIGPTDLGRISLNLHGLRLTDPPADTSKDIPGSLLAAQDSRTFAFGNQLSATVSGPSAVRTANNHTSGSLTAEPGTSAENPLARSEITSQSFKKLSHDSPLASFLATDPRLAGAIDQLRHAVDLLA